VCIFSNLEELTWKVQTASGLERLSMFLNPTLKAINLQVDSRLGQIENLLTGISSHTKLTGFSFVSPTPLPDDFTDLLHNQKGLEKVELVAPRALSPNVGQWFAKLPKLRTLQLNLTGMSPTAVEGFFEKVRESGYDTPGSVSSHDSGVFSNKEFNYSGFKRSVIRMTNDDESVGHQAGPYKRLKKLGLTGEIAIINVFLDQLSSELQHLDLVIEDPPESVYWSNFCHLVCEKFGQCLRSLHITATSKSIPKGDSNVPLPLQDFTYLPHLLRLDIDLPGSCIFTPADLESVGYACPSLEVLRLCPLARFQESRPQISLESIGWLTRGCRNLQILQVNVDAQPGHISVFQNRTLSSPSLRRIHLSNSWIEHPLQVTILLSHLAPYLESIKWFQDKNRPHYDETHDRNWQQVSDMLLHLQSMRRIDRSFAIELPPPIERVMVDKSVEAIAEKLNIGIQVRPQTTNANIQATPSFVSRCVNATVEKHSICIDATPEVKDVGIGETVTHAEVSIDAHPTAISVSIATELQPVEITEGSMPERQNVGWQNKHVYAIFSGIYRIFIFHSTSLPSRVIEFLGNFRRKKAQAEADFSTENDISMETVHFLH